MSEFDEIIDQLPPLNTIWHAYIIHSAEGALVCLAPKVSCRVRPPIKMPDDESAVRLVIEINGLIDADRKMRGYS